MILMRKPERISKLSWRLSPNANSKNAIFRNAEGDALLIYPFSAKSLKPFIVHIDRTTSFVFNVDESLEISRFMGNAYMRCLVACD